MTETPKNSVPEFRVNPEPKSTAKSLLSLGIILFVILTLMGVWVGFFSGFTGARGDPQKLLEIVKSSNPELARGAALEWSQKYSQTNPLGVAETGIVLSRLTQMGVVKFPFSAALLLMLGDSVQPEKVQPVICSALETQSGGGEEFALVLAGLGKSLGRGYFLTATCLESLSHFQNHPLPEIRATLATVLGAQFLKDSTQVESWLNSLYGDSFEIVRRSAVLSMIQRDSSTPLVLNFIESFFEESMNTSPRKYKVEDFDFSISLIGVLKNNSRLTEALRPQIENLGQKHPNLRIRSEFKKILEHQK